MFFQSWKNSLTCCETLDKPLPSGVGAEKELNGLISVNPAHMMVLARTSSLSFKPSHTAESSWERSHGCTWAMASHSLNIGEERQIGVFGSCLEGSLVESYKLSLPYILGQGC